MRLGRAHAYGSENTELPPPKPGENRVVFLGDEITENWGTRRSAVFPGKPYLNRGIARQTTPQMLVRFRQDVISLKPKVVVIQAGTNDLASVMGPATEGTMAENFMSMVELAKAQRHPRRAGLGDSGVRLLHQNMTAPRPQGKIIGLNGWIKEYAARAARSIWTTIRRWPKAGNLKKELTVDGLFPNDAGYAAMEAPAEQAISEALAKR